MKHQISRLSPHQNGKVVAALLAVTTFALLIPLGLIARVVAPPEAQLPLAALLLVPLLYLVVGYVGVTVACATYNVMYRFVGGLEYESAPSDTRL